MEIPRRAQYFSAMIREFRIYGSGDIQNAKISAQSNFLTLLSAEKLLACLQLQSAQNGINSLETTLKATSNVFLVATVCDSVSHILIIMRRSCIVIRRLRVCFVI
ncbi:Hypothetical_protein [Hexamita inflata]|uniref:Hypothetical_protein n=1 Tax=Hexamita inflata TaxID=28002 RepID=A0ABP1HBR8_9EUKA